MAIPYFVWNGTDCRTMHIRCGRIPVIRPEERVNHITVPGRAGELTQTEGAGIYNSYIQTVSISVVGAANIHAAEAWLTGDGYVTFHTQPQREQRARIINAVTLEKHSRNIDTWHAEVQFYCEPLKRQINEGPVEITHSATTITNEGDVIAYPTIEIIGSGTISISLGGNTLTLTDVVSGTVLDCANDWVLVNGVPQTGHWSGGFPKLQAGNNTILYTGSITKLNIQLNMRYL